MGSTVHLAFPDEKEGDTKASLGFAWCVELMWSEPQQPSGGRWHSRPPGDAEASQWQARGLGLEAHGLSGEGSWPGLAVKSTVLWGGSQGASSPHYHVFFRKSRAFLSGIFLVCQWE